MPVNPRLIKLHRCHTVEDVARRLGVHKNTVRAWQRDGLAAIDNSRPTLFLGSVLRAFLEAKRKAAKRPCQPGTIYCFKCRMPRAPAFGLVEYTPFNARSGNLSALCGACGTLMHRRASLSALGVTMPKIDVQISGGQRRISEMQEPSLNCDSNGQ